MESGDMFIQPMKVWASIPSLQTEKKVEEGGTDVLPFRSVLKNAIEQVRMTQEDVENKKYLLATGRLDDAHSLPIAEEKAGLSVEILVALRNKSMESYNELLKMNV